MEITKDNVREFIKNDIDSFNIRELILEIAPPFEWADNKHPINQLGHFYFGIGDGFKFDVNKVNKADELLLWKIYGMANMFWTIAHKESTNRTNMVCRMNYFEIKQEDVGKKMLKLYEEKYDWR